MPKPERPLVLVPGACLGGWAWLQVARDLRGRGHDVYPVTLTGLGERVHLATPEVDLETHIADVVNLLDYEALEDAVLVGHSYAGIVVTAVADRRPERMNAVVYLDASPLPGGMALHDIAPPELREAQQRDVDSRGDGWRWPVPDRETLSTGMYGSVAGLGEEHFDLIATRGTPQPWGTFTTALQLSHEAPPGRPPRRDLVHGGRHHRGAAPSASRARRPPGDGVRRVRLGAPRARDRALGDVLGAGGRG
jgi:pimeloyl-ACP methyl ester carboxylesterase